MEFQKPADSPEQRILLELAEPIGFDRIVIQKLFWLIDAHPNLLAFSQVAANLAAILETPQIAGLKESSNVNWPSHVPEWLRFCRWIDGSQAELAKDSRLTNLFLAPRSDRGDPAGTSRRLSHPLNHHGLSRHGVYAALWNRHESGDNAVTGGSHSAIYLALQAHLVFALATIREHCTRLTEYLEYDEEEEFSRDPRSTYPAALAVRNLSRRPLTPLLEHIAPEVPFSALVTALDGVKQRRDAVPGVDDKLAIDYPADLHSLFCATRDLIRTGRFDSPLNLRRNSKRNGGTKRGSRHLPGYINLSEHAFRYQCESTEDWAGSVDVVCLGKVPDEVAREEELAGDAPVEFERPVLALYSPEELKGAIARAGTAERIRTLAAQGFAWDLAHPNGTQLALLREVVVCCWRNFLIKPDNQQRQHEIQAALILETMLFLGKDHDAARMLRLRDPASAQVSEFALLVGMGSDGVPRVEGWRLPVIEADYRTELPEAQVAHGRPRARSYVVPDMTGLGDRVLEYAKITHATSAERPFTLHESTFLRVHKELCGSNPGLEQISLHRLARMLETTIYNQTGDWALAWTIGGDPARAGESRLFYAGYPVERLREAYASASNDILLRRGETAPPNNARLQAPDIRYAGARFIAPIDSVRKLLAGLKRDLKTFLPGGERTSRWTEYHNQLTLYTWLVQSLTTGIRPIRDPTEIIDQLEPARDPRLAVSLTDKETVFLERARPIRPSDILIRQLDDYRDHASFITNAMTILLPGLHSASKPLALFYLTARGKPVRLDRSWIEDQFSSRGYPFPANFARAFLRMELIDRGCPAESVDALLGHASAGEKPYAAMSSFDYGRHFQAIEDTMASLCRDIGLVHIGSRLLPR